MIPGFSSNLKSWFCEYWTTTDEKITALNRILNYRRIMLKMNPLLMQLEPVKNNLYFHRSISSYPLNAFEFRAELYSNIEGYWLFIFTISCSKLELKLSDDI